MKIFLKVIFQNRVFDHNGESRPPKLDEQSTHQRAVKALLHRFDLPDSMAEPNAKFVRALTPGEVGINEYGYGIKINNLYCHNLRQALRVHTAPQPAANAVHSQSMLCRGEEKPPRNAMPTGIMPFLDIRDIG